MIEGERQQNLGAATGEARYRGEVERLREIEHAARWQGEPLSEEQVQALAAFQKVYNEMAQGERFVQNHLRTLARTRGRWYIGLPAIGLALLGSALLGMLLRSTLSSELSSGQRAPPLVPSNRS